MLNEETLNEKTSVNSNERYNLCWETDIGLTYHTNFNSATVFTNSYWFYIFLLLLETFYLCVLALNTKIPIILRGHLYTEVKIPARGVTARLGAAHCSICCSHVRE